MIARHIFPPGMTSQDLFSRLRLIRSENVGPVLYHNLIHHYGSARAALQALPDLARRGGLKRTIKIPSVANIRAEIEALEALGGQFLALGYPPYPACLAAIEDAPPLLSMRGHSLLLQKPGVAIVGSRNASLNARKLAERIGKELTEAGFVVISGLARGIDSAAHRGSLQSGSTIAVIATGLDVVYPPENVELQESIAQRGLLISEDPLGGGPSARIFPRRNRIISGLARAVLVIEARLRSGSLITANHALNQGREVLAIPSSPLDSRSKGSNALLKEGASLVENTEDVIYLLSQIPHIESPGLSLPQTPSSTVETQDHDIARARSELESLLSPIPITVDEILQECTCPLAALSAALLEMEVAGRIERQAGQKIALHVSSDTSLP